MSMFLRQCYFVFSTQPTIRKYRAERVLTRLTVAINLEETEVNVIL